MEIKSQDAKNKTSPGPASDAEVLDLEVDVEVNKESLIEKPNTITLPSSKFSKAITKTPRWIKMCLPFCRPPPNVEIVNEDEEAPEDSSSINDEAKPEKSSSSSSTDGSSSIFDIGAVTLGGLYFDNSYCPAGNDIAELLIALGSLGMIGTAVSGWKSSLRKDAMKDAKELKLYGNDTPQNHCKIMTKYSCVHWFQKLLSLSKLGILGWLSTIIYTIYPKVNYQEPQPAITSPNSFQSALVSLQEIKNQQAQLDLNLDPNNYCNVTLFRISFWFVSILLSLLGLISVGMILFTPCSSIGEFLKPNIPNNSNSSTTIITNSTKKTDNEKDNRQNGNQVNDV